jgi:periplasmic protein TonB
MKRIFFILFLLPLSLNAQVVEDIEFDDEEDKSELKTDEGIIDRNPEKYPEFPGGAYSLKAFIKLNADHSCMEICGEGKVYITFVIDTVGTVTNIKIARGFCEPCDAEAKRIVSIMPKWVPGINYKKKVSFGYQLPIIFKLE